jgi:hypothetical protein
MRKILDTLAISYYSYGDANKMLSRSSELIFYLESKIRDLIRNREKHDKGEIYYRVFIINQL